jgi:hypothetical protein
MAQQLSAIIGGVSQLSDYIPLRDAMRVYRVSDDTLFRLIRLGRLRKHKRPFDRRTWLERCQLEELFGVPKPAADCPPERCRDLVRQALQT